jgi:hypothetical protein
MKLMMKQRQRNIFKSIYYVVGSKIFSAPETGVIANCFQENKAQHQDN